jgi:chromate reductase, NAD(P)H dehydrogenase (quinone)
MPIKILVFSGSSRQASLNQKLLDTAVMGAVGVGAEVSKIHLLDLRLPIYDGDWEAERGLPKGALTFKKLVAEHQALLIATPEHNGGYTALLKNALDWASRPTDTDPSGLSIFAGKIAALVSASPGRLGGTGARIALRVFLVKLGVLVVPASFALSWADQAFNEQECLMDANVEKMVLGVGAALTKTATELVDRAGREATDCLDSHLNANTGPDSTNECRRHDNLLDLAIAELQHRSRNLLTTVRWLARRTHSATVDGYRDALLARIESLSEAHELLEWTPGRPIFLAELLMRTLKSYDEILQDRIRLAGPDIDLEPRLALALHMVFHELATNASKHGALTSQTGWVEIHWGLLHLDGVGSRLAVLWSEHGGPFVSEPSYKGFGTTLISKALGNACVELSFRPTGVVCHMLLELEQSPTK